jgi:hypothetical protein
MRRALAIIIVLAPEVSCGFPDVTYEQGVDASAGAEGSAGGDGSGGGDAAARNDSEAGNSIEGGSGDERMADVAVDVAVPTDSSSGDHDAGTSEGGDASIICDQDHDTYNGPQCGGTDCCDTDPTANPGQMAYFTTKDACNSFDYNCDGTLQTEYDYNVTCTGLATSCTGQPGFTSDPYCGTQSPYSSCQPSGLGCKDMSTMMATQGCH